MADGPRAASAGGPGVDYFVEAAAINGDTRVAGALRLVRGAHPRVFDPKH